MSKQAAKLARGLLTSAALLPLAAFCFSPATPAWAADTPPMLLQADQIVYDSDSQTVSAVGHVEIVDGVRILDADNVTYDQNSDKVTASGHVSVTDDKGNVAFADHVVLTDRMRNGALSGFGALIGKNGRLAAVSAQRVQDRIVIAQRAIYSACKICAQQGQRTPLWQVKSERVVYDQQKHRIHFTDATVDFLGVPILYTPYLTEPDPTVKYASGLLAPDLGNSSTLGYFARLPVYVALSDSNDLTVAPEFTTLGGQLIEAEYRARWNNGGMWLQGSGANNPNGGLGGGPAGPQDYDHLFGSGRFAIDDTWSTGFNAQLTNNKGYMYAYDISFLDRLTNDLFVEDAFGRSRFAMTGYYFEGLRSTDVASRIPYVAPLIDYSYIPMQNILGGQFRLDVNGIALARGTGRDEQRLTSEVNWSKPMVMGGGQLWTFILDGRGDAYNLQNPALITGPGATQDIERGTGYGELDWRWPFVASGGPGYSYLLEPIAQIIGQPYVSHPAALRDEDSSDFEFDANNLFSADQVPGYDLIESGPRANVGLRAQTAFPTGEAVAVIGQTIRMQPDPIFSADSGESGDASDVVGEVSVKFPHLDVTDSIDLDRSNGTLRRHEFYITGSYGRSSLQITYLQLPSETLNLGLPSEEQVNAQADINFYQNWEGFVAVERDLISNQMLGTEYGLGYEDDCFAISLGYRRKYAVDTNLGLAPSTSVVLHFSLKTGDQPVQPFSLFPKNVFNPSSHT
jgi:LPS-assembly protein